METPNVRITVEADIFDEFSGGEITTAHVYQFPSDVTIHTVMEVLRQAVVALGYSETTWKEGLKAHLRHLDLQG
jgi:hypothetical protein